MLTTKPTDPWQQELRQAFSNTDELCRYLNIAAEQLPISSKAAQNFQFRVPLSYAAAMEKGNPYDPLLRQVLPINQETAFYPGFIDDPVADLDAIATTGVVHKYQGRVLLITTGSCAIHCRYCFRRNFPYSEYQLSKKAQANAINYIKNNPNITEVILSGGDPLLLSDNRLSALLHDLGLIPHLQRIRIHTRIPIVLPSRINAELIQILQGVPQPIVIVLHSNHANEISTAVVSACAKLKAAQITLLNQAVLLKDVNDDADQLCRLSEQLFAAGILPYYLHLLDKAAGTAHFEVAAADAVKIMHQLKKRLPGYLVPKLVREQAGALYKIAIMA